MIFMTISIDALAKTILYHKRLYYTGKPEISDEEYDLLEQRLRTETPDHPTLNIIGNPSLDSGLARVQHAIPMLSLDKTYKISDLEDWLDNRSAVGSLKLDGNSLSLMYLNGKFQLAKTRGNGREGEDVTAKIFWVENIPKVLTANFTGEIRGELCCSFAKFTQLSFEMEKRQHQKPGSPRNIVAGILGRKEDIDLSQYFDFFAFDLIDDQSKFTAEWEKFQWLQKQNFATPEPTFLQSKEDINLYLGFVKNLLTNYNYGLDGAVFTFNDLELHEKLGNTSHHPRYKISFKWQGQTAETVIEKIFWSTSRLGIVTPVAAIKAVYLSGAEITNVTLHNAAHVQSYQLKAGDKIEVVRSGEVIPKFLRVLESASGGVNWPTKCTDCGETLTYDGIRLICGNSLGCPAQIKGKIQNWLRCVEVDDLSDKRLGPMLDLGMIRDVSDLYKLAVEDFLKLPLTKKTMAEKLFKNIQKSKLISLPFFLNALGIEGIGFTTWEKILDAFPTIGEIQDLTVDDLMKLDGLAEKSAEVVVAGLKDSAPLIRKLLDLGFAPTYLPKKKIHSQLSGKSFVITGTLTKPREEIAEYIKIRGGKVSAGVTRGTFALITNDDDPHSSKAKKAAELRIPIWSELKLYEMG